MGYSHFGFVMSAAGLSGAVAAGPGTIPTCIGFWKIPKGSGSPRLPKRICGEEVRNPGAGT